MKANWDFQRRESFMRSLNELRVTMLWTVLFMLLVPWMMGMQGGVGGSLIHLLLILAVMLLVFNVLRGWRSAA